MFIESQRTSPKFADSFQFPNAETSPLTCQCIIHVESEVKEFSA